jgi:hypothetical protein
MQKLILSAMALFAFVLTIPACKDKEEEVTGFGSVEIEFDNQAGGSTLTFGTNYTNTAGETVQFTTFDYYISNVVLEKADGTRYVVPKNDSYFLCKHEDADTRLIKLENVPAGDYTKLEFMVGVDSAKSVSPISERVGVLDPATGANGHYWSWNSGYIFVKMEGTSPVAPAASGNIFQYHVGLFGGFDSPTLNNLRTIKLTVPDEAAIVRQGGETPHFHLLVDAMEIFGTPNTISVAATPFSHGDANSAKLSANYADMFVIDHVHN